MTNLHSLDLNALSLNELKTLALGLEITGHKGRKASYVAALEVLKAETSNFDAMTEDECEAWMEEATGVKIGTNEVSDAEMEQIAHAADEALAAPAATHRSAVTIALIPVILVIMAVALAMMTVTAIAPIAKRLGAILMGLRVPKAVESIDYFPELAIA